MARFGSRHGRHWRAGGGRDAKKARHSAGQIASLGTGAHFTTILPLFLAIVPGPIPLTAVSSEAE